MILIGGLIPLALLLIVGWICARTLRRAVTIPAHLLRGERCGKCAYELGGVDTPNCPECGADLYDVGVVTPVMQLERRPGGCAVSFAWTVLASITSIVSFVGIGVFSSSFMSESDTSRVQTSTIFTPTKVWNETTRQGVANKYSLDLTTDVILVKDQFKRGTIGLSITAPGEAPAHVRLDANTLRPTGSESSFDLQAALTLMREAGLDTSRRSIRDEAAHLVEIVASKRHGQGPFHPLGAYAQTSSYLNSLGSFGTTTFIGPPKGLIPALATSAICAAVWVVGLVWINRRRQALYTQAAAAEPG